MNDRAIRPYHTRRPGPAARDPVTNVMAGSAAASDPSGLFDPTWWQSGLIVLAWMVVAYIIGMMVVRRSDVK